MREKTLSQRFIHEGIITDYLIKEVELPNGEKSTREIVLHDPAVAVFALDDDGQALFVKQFRSPIERVIYEIPAGRVDEGEDKVQAAKRELEEETGYRAEEWEVLAEFYTSVGFSDEFMTIYQARKLTKVNQHLTLDEDEFLEVELMDYPTAMEKYHDGLMPDSKTVVALKHWQTLLK